MQKTNWKKGWIIIWVVVCLYGCATTGDVRILDEESRILHSQLNTLQKETESIKKDLSTFQKVQKVVEEDVTTLRTDLNAEMKKLQADLLLRLDTLQSEIRILSTGVEEYKEFLKKPSREIDRMKEDVEVRLRILEEKEKVFEDKNISHEERTKGLEERIKGFEGQMKGLEERLKGLDQKIASKPLEVEKPIPAKEPDRKSVV